MTNEIWVIGTDPPCPRCALVTKRVQSALESMGLRIPVRHLSYSDPVAQRFAKSRGQEVGTAKDVARAAGMAVDIDTINEIVARQWLKAAKALGCPPEDVPPAERWSPELDTALRPFEEKAKEIGFMMTPVLVIDGVVRHQGSVPSPEQIAAFLAGIRTEPSPQPQL